MAKRRTRTRTRTVRVGAARSASPIVIRTSSTPTRRRRASRRRSSGGGFGFGVGGILGHMLGGALFGHAVKAGWVDKLPAIPVVGRTGTAAFLLDAAAKRGMMSSVTRPAANAAAVLAGYQLGTEGSIHGDAGTPTYFEPEDE